MEEKRDRSGILYIYDRVLKKGAHLNRWVKVLVAPNLEVMEDDCFYKCPELERAITPKLKKIGRGCFDECPKLKELISNYLKLDGIVLFGSLIIDLKNKEILNTGTLESGLVRALSNEIKNDNELKIEQKEGCQVLKSGDYEILKEENGVITGICLPTTKVLPSHSLYENDTVNELILLQAEKIDHNAVYKAFALKKVMANEVREVRFSNFSKCPNLELVEAKNLFSIEQGCFSDNEKLVLSPYDNLESVAGNCFCRLPATKVLSLKSAVAIGEGSVQHNENMHAVLLPELIEFERGIFFASNIQYLYAPKVINRSFKIKYLKNAKQLMKNHTVLLSKYKDFIRE